MRKTYFTQSLKGSAGMSLIETIVALGILTTGVVGGLSLAVYAVSVSDMTLNQVIATNLAREGIEIVRGIRDTNWLNDTLSPCSWDGSQDCYDDWLQGFSGLSSSLYWYANFTSSSNSWSVSRLNGGATPYLNLQSNGVYTHTGLQSNTVFARRIGLTRDTAAPFSNANPRLVVTSTVWWKDRGCALSSTPPITGRCKIVVQDYLTNWKNY